MPAAVENAVFANTPAWHGLGTVVDTEGDKGISIGKALELSGLDWEVRKVPSFALSVEAGLDDYKDFMEKVKSGAELKYSDLVWAKDRFAVQRMTDGKVLGVVGSGWTPIQNADGFQLVDELCQQAGGKAWVESAGSLNGGSQVWVLVHIDTEMQIAGEDYASYLLFTNGHNGRTSVTAAAMDERVVCANTLDIGLSQADATGRIVRVRHTTKAEARIKAASAILGMRNKRAEELAQQGEWLADTKFTDKEWDAFMTELMPVPNPDEDSPAKTMIEGRKATLSTIYYDAPNLEPIRGTKWGALQAVLEYSDHARNFTNQETQLKAQWGLTAQPLKQQAYDLLVAA